MFAHLQLNLHISSKNHSLKFFDFSGTGQVVFTPELVWKELIIPFFLAKIVYYSFGPAVTTSLIFLQSCMSDAKHIDDRDRGAGGAKGTMPPPYFFHGQKIYRIKFGPLIMLFSCLLISYFPNFITQR